MLVTLLTGSNATEREAILHRTAEVLAERVGQIVVRSRIYTSSAWGFTSAEPFANQALRINTSLSPIEVLDAVLEVEQAIGRNRAEEEATKRALGERYASRVVDVDVMFCDDEIICESRLRVPHPLLHEREFALEPLCEIMADYRHPVLGQRLKDIYEELKKKN